MNYQIQKPLSRIQRPRTKALPLERHHVAIRVLHWLVAVMVVTALVMSTFVMSKLANEDPQKLTGLLRHMGVGILIFICMLIRLFVRKTFVHPVPLSSGVPWADRLATIMHRILDIMVFVMVTTGIGMAIIFKLPALVVAGKGIIPAGLDRHALYGIHIVGAGLLATLLIIHVFGALYHHFVLKDGLLSRMGFTSQDLSK